MAFGLGCDYIARFEGMAQGIQWSNINRAARPNDNFNFLNCLIMMLADSVIYLLLTLYIENVFPGKAYACGTSNEPEDLHRFSVQVSMAFHNHGTIRSRKPIGSVSMRKRFANAPRKWNEIKAMILSRVSRLLANA